MTARQFAHFHDGGGHLESFGTYMSSLSVTARRLIVSGFVLLAGLLLMLARTSPALAADSGHGQGKAHDQTSASAISNRHDSPTAKEDQHIGGGGDGGGKGKGGGGTGSGSHTHS